jgi:hypothetical protein
MKLKNKRRRILVEEAGKQKFLELAEKFRRTEDWKEVRRLGNELGKMVFGVAAKRPPRKAAAT